MSNKELDIQGCKVFVCPNLKIIREKGKELQLKDNTIKKAEELAIRYFKKTCHAPRYSSAKFVMPAFLYIISIFENERRTQKEIAMVFGTTEIAIRKWYVDIVNEMNIDLINSGPNLYLTYEYEGKRYI